MCCCGIICGEPVATELEAKIAVYLRRIQGAHGGWPLFHDGAFDISASVKAYFALKMIGDDPKPPHMRAGARSDPGARRAPRNCNVFTRMLLALYGVIPWRSVPVMPVEIMLLPRWFPFHLDKISYWARTVIVPLAGAAGLEADGAQSARRHASTNCSSNRRQVSGLRRKRRIRTGRWILLFRAIDMVLRAAEPLFPEGARGGARSTRRWRS